MYISADLFQSSSVLDYSCNPPTPSCRLQAAAPTILQTASYYAAGCRIQPTLYHLKGVSLICHRPPQVATGCRTPSPPPPRPGPETGAAAPTGLSNSLLWLPW